MMDQMAPAKGWELVAVQKSMQPITGKFRDHDGVHQGRDESNEGDVKAFVNHRCFTIQFLPAAPETKHKTVNRDHPTQNVNGPQATRNAKPFPMRDVALCRRDLIPVS